MIREYTLHEAGMTYAQQGFMNADGQIWAWKMDEHLLVSGFFNEARQMKYGW